MNWSILGKTRPLAEWREFSFKPEAEFDQNLSFLKDWFSEDDVIQVKTSGSTGTPKLISLSKTFMTSSALATAKYFELLPGSRVLQCLPTQFISGKMMMVRALENDWDLTIIESSSAPSIPIGNFDFCSLTPMQLENLIHDDAQNLRNIRIILLGGAPVSQSLLQKVQDLKSKIFLSYGMTETASHVAIRTLNGHQASEIFTALGDYFFAQDNRGCLMIYHPPSAQEWVSNDSVELLNPRQFRFLGRLDNIINSGGLKIHPENLEKKLSEFLPLPFYFIGVQDELLGEKLILLIEGELPKEEVDEAIKKALKDFPSSYYPKEIRFVHQFERTDSDKIIRKAL